MRPDSNCVNRYNKWTGPLEKKAAELPEWAWSAVEPTQWQDGTEHLAQYAAFTYQPGGCERPKHFAVVRHKAVQGELFWRHAFVVGAAGMEPRLRFEHHRLKGGQGAGLHRTVARLGPASRARPISPTSLRIGAHRRSQCSAKLFNDASRSTSSAFHLTPHSLRPSPSRPANAAIAG